jgi:hypothetical protein
VPFVNHLELLFVRTAIQFIPIKAAPVDVELEITAHLEWGYLLQGMISGQ